jgi:hypothetical protein
MHSDTVISHFIIWNSLSPLGNYNGSQRNQKSKQIAAATTDITFTIPDTLEISRKHGSATSQSVTKAAYNSGMLTIYNLRKKLLVRN